MSHVQRRSSVYPKATGELHAQRAVRLVILAEALALHLLPAVGNGVDLIKGFLANGEADHRDRVLFLEKISGRSNIALYKAICNRDSFYHGIRRYLKRL